MDESEWPQAIVLMASLATTVILARLGSIGNALSRSSLERLAEDGVPRARLLLFMYRPYNILGQIVAYGQIVSISAGCVAFLALAHPVFDRLPQPMIWRIIAIFVFALIAIAIPPVLLGYVLGTALVGRMSETRFRQSVVGVVLTTSFVVLVREALRLQGVIS